MTSPYQPIALANEFIVKATPSGLEHMKIQKLVYLTYGWWLVFNKTPIFSEELRIQKRVPVFKSLYRLLKGSDQSPISTLKTNDRVDKDDKKILLFIEWVWRKYETRTFYTLADSATFAELEGELWQQIVEKNYKFPYNTIIPAESLRGYFRSLFLLETPILANAPQK